MRKEAKDEDEEEEVESNAQVARRHTRVIPKAPFRVPVLGKEHAKETRGARPGITRPERTCVSTGG